jgi:hypothetical protein
LIDRRTVGLEVEWVSHQELGHGLGSAAAAAKPLL